MTDAADDAGQQLRTAVIQAVQTATMFAQYQRTLNMDRRAATEHVERQTRAKLSDLRSNEIHDLQKQGYADRSDVLAVEKRDKQQRAERAEADFERRERESAAEQQRKSEIHDLQKQGYAHRSTQGDELHQLKKQAELRRMARSDADLERRDHADAAEQARKTEIHDLQKAGYANREARAAEVHQLERQERLERMAIRRRAAGLSEELAKAGAHDNDLAATIAGFAAATATADLGPDQRRAADAWSELLHDAGLNPDDITTAADIHPRPGADNPSTEATTAAGQDGAARADTDAPLDPAAARIADLVEGAFDLADAPDHGHDTGADSADAVAHAGLGHPNPPPGQHISLTPPVLTPPTVAAPAAAVEEGLDP